MEQFVSLCKLYSHYLPLWKLMSSSVAKILQSPVRPAVSIEHITFSHPTLSVVHFHLGPGYMVVYLSIWVIFLSIILD